MSRVALSLCAVVVIALFVSVPFASAQQPGGEAIVARNAIVIDAQTGAVLLEQSADQPVPPASLTKIFTAVTAAEITASQQPMVATDGDLVGEASMGLAAGESDTFDTLLHGMLLSSGNDAAMTIARNLSAADGNVADATTDPFVTYMNARIKDLGATNTHLVNPHGLDAPGHTSTARDLATITRYGLASLPAFREALGATTYTGDGHSLYSTNQLAGNYPGLLGGKTGITPDAGYCLIEVAERDGRTIIAVLLGSTADAWYADARSLLDRGFMALAVAVTEPAAEPNVATSNGSGLVVSGAGSERVVASATVASRKAHAPGVWGIMAVVAIPCLLVIGVIAARIMESPARRPTQRRRSATVRPHQTAAPSPNFADFSTAPFPTVAQWRDVPRGHPHRPQRAAEPVPVPSFGD